VSALSNGASGAGSPDAWHGHDTAAYQRFLRAARGFWSTELYQALRRQTGPIAPPCADDTAFEALVLQHPTHQAFAWLERHLQRMKYSGPFGLVQAREADRAALLERLEAPLPDGLLSLDPQLPLPDYSTAFDIHQHPGGLHCDPLAALVYRDATESGVVGKPQLHERFARLATAGRRPTRILDLGCGFGRSTLAFANAAPGAHVQGIDLSASCLTVAAHATPSELRTRVKFAQADAVASGLPAGSHDLVTSTMLLHEMPEDAIRMLIAETGRLAAHGGTVIHLDFLPPPDPLLRLLFSGHGRRNNEPYLLEHARIDLHEAYTRAGFRSVRAVDFAEDDDALHATERTWRLPWTMIIAEK
jgi:ubiquinone/menaquinone biosynthesis C-methylase UbiE